MKKKLKYKIGDTFVFKGKVVATTTNTDTSLPYEVSFRIGGMAEWATLRVSEDALDVAYDAFGKGVSK